MKKKLIEVALPLEAINYESAREKSIRHGHPSTLHLWWARRPLVAARSVIWASLVDDPSSHPDQFPTEADQQTERERLFAILERLVKWENSNNEAVLAEAKAEILKSTNGKPPALLDPFAGGGSIPLEAQRLGLEAHAHDLNPVAVMINKAMIEIPPRFAGRAPVHPNAGLIDGGWKGAAGLAEDVRYYGEGIRERAFERIGHLYPKVRDGQGKDRTVIAWLWTRTVKCPNPACGCEMPLASSFELSKKKGKEAYVQPVIEGNHIRYEVRQGKGAPDAPKIGRGQFRCICCGTPTSRDYIQNEFKAKRNGSQLMAVVAEGDNGRLYLSPDPLQIKSANCPLPDWKPEAEMNQNCTDLVSGRGYGIQYWYELFTNRQLTALTTFSDLVGEAQQQAESDARAAFRGAEAADETPLAADGLGPKAYGEAIAVYLAFAVDRLADRNSSFSTWDKGYEKIRNTFARQAIAMAWDFAEGNLFSASSGSFSSMLEWVVKSLGHFPAQATGAAKQADAQSPKRLELKMISTDPPYYDNIGYADLSDFFYVWLRQSLRSIYPDVFRTMLVPKAEELVATPYRFDGDRDAARKFFESGMTKAFREIYAYACGDIPVTVYYAYKQSESGEKGEMASTGWETMLTAIVQAGFVLTGTWPIRTEMLNRSNAMEANALASSIVLVCRKRSADAAAGTRRDFLNALKRELKPALEKLQSSNLAPVDLAQAAIGPGMAVYSRFAQVLEADGSKMSVRTALQLINRELDAYFSDQDGDLDSETRFCVDLFSQYGFKEMAYGEANVLMRAKNADEGRMKETGVLRVRGGTVSLVPPTDVPMGRKSETRGLIWLLTQQLVNALKTGGVDGAAKLIQPLRTSAPDRAKALAYRLYQVAERKGWAADASLYNDLVVAWPEIQSRVGELNLEKRGAKQLDLLDR